MVERFILIIGSDGAPMHMPWAHPDRTLTEDEFGPVRAWEDTLPEGATEVPHLPDPGHEWDGEAFAVPTEKAQLVADAMAGKAAIERSHSRKLMEALLIKAGIELPASASVLVREATDRKIEPEAMADLVMSKVEAAALVELDRQKIGIAIEAEKVVLEPAPPEKAAG